MKIRAVPVLAAFLIVVAMPFGLFGQPAARATAQDEVRNAIVKIYSVINKPDYFRPWNMFTEQVSGSGCIISGNRILTSAHVVANATFIEVQRRGRVGRFRAHVDSVSHEKDLALLRVEDASFFDHVRPLTLGDLPSIQQPILVLGFPMGGTTLSATQGVVSRIEHVNYVHSSAFFLAVQIDAAINPGNSGGPAIADGKIIGIAMQAYPHAENIGYIVPTPIIRHFMADLADGRQDGSPSAGIMVQPMENPDLRRYYNLPVDRTGVLVTRIQPESPARGKVRRGDVLINVDGHSIANDGSVAFRPGERTWFGHYIDLHQRGERVMLEILRDGEPCQARFPLTAPIGIEHLVPLEEYDRPPRFFVYGGIVFSPLTRNLLRTWGGRWFSSAPPTLVQEMSRWPTRDSRELVVVLHVLAAEVNVGYHDFNSWIVRKVNGEPYLDFDDFHRKVMSSSGPFVSFENEQTVQILIDRQKALDTHAVIIAKYRIKYDHSPDLGR